VTVVHPGGTRTERTTPEAEANLAKNNTIHRAVDASDIANVVVFLASPKSVAITGDTIAAGGGVGKAIHY
jgi:NAD(P)-dependent dehydrogenase (short-subunit alcohol dehydrogenase family)